MNRIVSRKPYLHIYQRRTVGGGVIGANQPTQVAPSQLAVGCPACDCWYPIASEPVGFAFSPAGARVLDGYVEQCPHCLAQFEPGERLTICGVAL